MRKCHLAACELWDELCEPNFFKQGLFPRRNLVIELVNSRHSGRCYDVLSTYPASQESQNTKRSRLHHLWVLNRPSHYFWSSLQLDLGSSFSLPFLHGNWVLGLSDLNARWMLRVPKNLQGLVLEWKNPDSPFHWLLAKGWGAGFFTKGMLFTKPLQQFPWWCTSLSTQNERFSSSVVHPLLVCPSPQSSLQLDLSSSFLLPFSHGNWVLGLSDLNARWMMRVPKNLQGLVLEWKNPDSPFHWPTRLLSWRETKKGDLEAPHRDG